MTLRYQLRVNGKKAGRAVKTTHSIAFQLFEELELRGMIISPYPQCMTLEIRAEKPNGGWGEPFTVEVSLSEHRK